MKQRLHFPFDYHSFNNGINVSDKDVDRFVKEITIDLKEDRAKHKKRPSFSYRATGNTVCFGFWLPGDEMYDIYVCKNYWEAIIEPGLAGDDF